MQKHSQLVKHYNSERIVSPNQIRKQIINICGNGLLNLCYYSYFQMPNAGNNMTALQQQTMVTSHFISANRLQFNNDT